MKNLVLVGIFLASQISLAASLNCSLNGRSSHGESVSKLFKDPEGQQSKEIDETVGNFKVHVAAVAVDGGPLALIHMEIEDLVSKQISKTINFSGTQSVNAELSMFRDDSGTTTSPYAALYCYIK